MSSNLPARRDPVQVGQTLAASGYFQDAREAAQAAVKVMAGEELGLGPIAAMTGIHIVKGKVTLSANLIAGLIKRSGRYDFRVRRLDGEGCEVVFFEGGQEIGVSSFDRKDAEAAGLWGQAGPWRQHPRNMFYARAMSNGAKWYCPDVLAGPIYTPDELGLEVDGETGEVIEASVPPPAALPAPAEPIDAADDYISESQRRRLFAIAKECQASTEWVKAIVLDITGQDSTKKIPRDKYESVIDAVQAGAAAEHVAAGGEALPGLEASDAGEAGSLSPAASLPMGDTPAPAETGRAADPDLGEAA